MEKKEERVKEILFQTISDLINIPYGNISFTSRFVEDLNYDSLDSVETIMKLEDAFDTELDDVTMEKMKTVKEVYEHLLTLPHTATEAPNLSRYTFTGTLVEDSFDESECAEIECGEDITVSIRKYDTRMNDNVFPKILDNFRNKRVLVTVEILDEPKFF